MLQLILQENRCHWKEADLSKMFCLPCRKGSNHKRKKPDPSEANSFHPKLTPLQKELGAEESIRSWKLSLFGKVPSVSFSFNISQIITCTCIFTCRSFTCFIFDFTLLKSLPPKFLGCLLDGSLLFLSPFSFCSGFSCCRCLSLVLSDRKLYCGSGGGP